MTTVQNNASTAVDLALSSLFVSPGNVRKAAPGGIEELAVMIAAQGLLQPLHVTAEMVAGAPTGRYAVEAGGRRLRALMLLASRGQVAADMPVECRLIDVHQALEISLTENISQESMHPADEFDAYQALVAQGRSLEAVAGKFGVTVVHVQRRLKLANVAPELIGLYRKGEMSLDQVMALATTDDQARQVLTWNSLSAYSRQPYSIKRMLIEGEVAASDARVTLVGLDAYLAAGGQMRTDLFSEEGAQYLTDAALLESLVIQRLESEAAGLRAEGWAWVEVIRNVDYYTRQAYVLPEKKYLPDTPEQLAQRNSLSATGSMPRSTASKWPWTMPKTRRTRPWRHPCTLNSKRSRHRSRRSTRRASRRAEQTRTLAARWLVLNAQASWWCIAA